MHSEEVKELNLNDLTFPQIGQIKVNFIFLINKNITKNFVIWDNWTCNKIIRLIISKCSDYFSNQNKYNLLIIKNGNIDELIKNNDINGLKKAFLKSSTILSGNVQINKQFDQFEFKEDSFPCNEAILFICDRNKIDLYNQINHSLESVSQDNLSLEPLASINDYLEEKQDTNYPWDIVHDNDNLVNLTYLAKDVLIEQLYKRYRQGCFYSYVDNILIFLNPYCSLPLYNPKYSNIYRDHKLGSKPPHIFGMVDHIYYNMLKTKRSHCILISGESGSGKTESSKQIIQHITFLNQYGTQSKLVSAILASSNVLEAFGNAQNVQNKNSSRFGKFTQIIFNCDGAIVGVNLTVYLLEKSRLVSHDINEKNFHVFYYFLSLKGQALKNEFQSKNVEDYEYLKPILINMNQCMNSKNYKILF
ncbi:hypothetical protein HZS_5790 [Henneguya salminicola]|nr:hypothetical protein HZS_5790 [Henneguya salminicola]